MSIALHFNRELLLVILTIIYSFVCMKMFYIFNTFYTQLNYFKTIYKNTIYLRRYFFCINVLICALIYLAIKSHNILCDIK